MPGPSKMVNKLQIKFPKLASPPLYKHFVNNFVRSPGTTRKVLSAVSKELLDADYERQLRSMPTVDDKSLSTYLSQCKGQEGQAVWSKEVGSLQLRHSTYGGASETNVTEVDGVAIKDLKTPNIGRASAPGLSHTRDQLKRQTYAEFATKAEKRNPEIVFNQAVMDEAFRWQATQLLSDKFPYKSEFEAMMIRCLGRESDDYWEGR